MSRKRTGIVEAAMRNHNIVILIAVLLMIVGIVALKKMPRNEFPQFTIRQGVIVGVYPGANSAEVEAQLTRVVENYIFSYQEVNKVKTHSESKEGIMYIFVELNDNVKNADQFWSKLKHGLDELKSSLPNGVLALVANSDFGDTSALLITLSSDTRSYKELEEELKKLEAECRKIPAASKIKHYGLQKEKIFVNVKPELLNEYNIKTLSLLGSYQSNGMVSYAGQLKTDKKDLAVHLPQNYASEEDLANQIVYSDPKGNVVRLKDIATIERRYDDPDSYIKQNGKKAILLSLEMQPGNNIVEFGQQVDKALDKFQKQCPPGIDVRKISELPKYVDDSVSDFMREFLIAIVAVILVTMILLPFRVASVAGVTIPITVLVTLAFLYFFGIELHTVSLASLILVLGMIVDNSIVVIDNHVSKLDLGISSWYAANISARELITPVITATLAIMAAYIPLGFMVPGTAGEFMQTIPIVVSTALILSILTSILLVPYLNFVFIKKGLEKKDKKKSFLDVLQKWFDKNLEKAFRHPKKVIAAGIGIIFLSVIIFKSIDQQLFPEMERNQFAVEIYLPTGSSLASTSKIVDSLEQMLLKDKRVTNVASFTGTSSPRFQTVYAPNMPSPNYGQLLINTVSNEATRSIVKEYQDKYSNCFPNAHVKWKILAMQAFKAPVEIRISSDSIKDIRKTESQVYDILRKTKAISWLRDDWDQMQENVKVNIDRDKANRLGYSKGLIATSIMVGLNSVPLTTIWEDDYPVQVCLTQESEKTKNMATLENQYVTSPQSFSAVPLRSLASFSPEWTEGTIVHRNGIRTLTILADNDSKRVSSSIFDEIRPKIDKLKLPEGTTIEYGGEYESQNETFVPMAIALLVSIVLIFFILLFQFKKEKLSLLIISTMLLTLPGAAMGLKLMGYPFSITAFIGITSLCGIVVRNGIILIDYARELREKKKMSVREAALSAGKRRMRPIFLTSAAASVGVIPMIISRSPLWGPVGTVICFGLLVSMVLTLFILPVLYASVYSDKAKTTKSWTIPPKGSYIGFKSLKLFLLLVCSTFILKTQAQTPVQHIIGLDSCKQLALTNNKKIKEAEFDVKAAEETKKNAYTNYFPNVSAMGFAMKSADYLVKGSIPQMNLPVYDGNLANLANATQYAYIPSIPIKALDYLNTASISASVPVYAGGRIRNGNKLASLGAEVSQSQQIQTTTDVLVRTEELYWTLISLKEREKTLISYKVMLDTLYRDVNNYKRAGLSQRNDLLKVQLKQNEIRTNMLKLQDGIELSSRALCQHIGINYDSTMVFDCKTISPDSIIAQPDAKSMVTNRIEYTLLKKAVEAEELQQKLTSGEYMPQVAVGGIGMVYGAMDKRSKNAFAFATVSIPISDWWGGTHKIRQQRLKIEKAKTSLDENTELLTLQIVQAGNEVKENYFQIEVAKKSVEQARENLKVSGDNYKVGVIGISDLLEAQAMFQNANNDLTDAQCNYQIKITKYLQATGRYK